MRALTATVVRAWTDPTPSKRNGTFDVLTFSVMTGAGGAARFPGGAEAVGVPDAAGLGVAAGSVDFCVLVIDADEGATNTASDAGKNAAALALVSLTV